MNFNTTLAVFLHVTAQQRGFGCLVESISFLAHVQHAYTKLLTAYEKQRRLHGLLLCTLGHSTLRTLSPCSAVVQPQDRGGEQVQDARSPLIFPGNSLEFSCCYKNIHFDVIIKGQG